MYTLVSVVSKQGCIYVANKYPTSARNMPIASLKLRISCHITILNKKQLTMEKQADSSIV